ncbi:MAG: iron-containing alcohol dehydrogenase [Ruminococcaceae bacterium]|nr:iron-containing alcohol dehydrogenase [Oscillospiraceae bacterium]
MLDFEYFSPTSFHFGRKAEVKAGAVCRQFGGSRVLIHYGSESAKKSGLVERVRTSIEEAGLFAVELGGVVPNPRVGLVYQGIELARKERIDLILAIGGGSVIDSGKAIAMGVVYSGDVWDFFDGKAVPEGMLPVGCVLTIPAAGSEGSLSSVISSDDGKTKRGLNHPIMRPAFALMNPELTYTLPPYQTACGISDMMAHIIERYLSNTTEVELTDRLCEGAMKAIIHEAPKVFANPEDYGARANIMWAGTLAHSDIMGVGREQDWASHRMGHQLSALYNAAHGSSLAVMIPAFMRYTLEHGCNRYAQMAVRVFDCDYDFENPQRTAAQAVERLVNFYRSIGLPTSLTEIGAKEEDIPFMTKTIQMHRDNQLGNFQPLGYADIEKIYRLAL